MGALIWKCRARRNSAEGSNAVGEEASHADPDEKAKAELLKYSYEQVLDATKHQDDKVGRLLTTIAFLTAASLALAGLGGAKAISTPVNLGGDSQDPVGAIAVGFVCLVAFLIAVTITVIQLIGSLSTPLRLPGLDPARRDPEKRSVASTIYFHEIEKNTPEEWEALWQSSAGVLQTNRVSNLVAETRNLAVRTSFKYNRTSEATAVFIWALIALSLTVAFAAIAVMDRTQPLVGEPSDAPEIIQLTFFDMLLVGSLLGVVTFVWSWARFRHSRVARDDKNDDRMPRLQLAVVYGSALTVFWVAGLPLALEEWGPSVYEVGVAALSFFTATSMSWATWAQARPRRRRGVLRLLMTAVLTPALFGGLACLDALWRLGQWQQALPWVAGAVAGSVVGTIFAKFVGVTIRWDGESDAKTLSHEGSPQKCPLCVWGKEQDKAKRVRWRVAAILTISGILALMAQRFQVDNAYVWPLAASCGALTTLIGGAVVEPTFIERQERRIKNRRSDHVSKMAASVQESPLNNGRDRRPT